MTTEAGKTSYKTEEEMMREMFDLNGERMGMGTTKQSLLTEADALINGQRQEDYGDKLQNFAQIAMGLQMILAPKLQHGQEITPEDVAMCMIQVKIARLAKSPDHRDSILDVAGYAGCYDKIQEERNNGTWLLGATRDARRNKG